MTSPQAAWKLRKRPYYDENINVLEILRLQ